MLTTCMVGCLQEHRLGSHAQKAGRSGGLTHTVIVVAKICEHVLVALSLKRLLTRSPYPNAYEKLSKREMGCSVQGYTSQEQL